MQVAKKMNDILNTPRDSQEIQRWMFSLIPLGVAFVFFFIFMLSMQIPNKDIILVTGAAAGFAGLEAYWVFRGWQRNEGLTILLGIVGIVLTGIFVWWYVNYLSEIMKQLFQGWLG